MEYPIEHRKHTPEEQLYLIAAKKLVAILNLQLDLGHITQEEFESCLRNKLAMYSRCTEAQRYIEYLLKEETGSGYASSYERQIKAEGCILAQSNMVADEPLALPDILRRSSLEKADWELGVLEKLLEKKEPVPEKELQLLYAMKQVIVLNMEVDLGRIQEEDCGSRLEAELAKPGYCAEARQYLQEMLYEMTDDETSNYWGLAQGRRDEMESELFGDGFTEPSWATEMGLDPRYFELEAMQRELEVLKDQLEAAWAA